MVIKQLKKLIGHDAHWTLNKVLVKRLGLSETLVLQHLIDLETLFKKDEIFQPITQMSDRLGISEYAIKQAIGKLKSLGIISVERKSVGYMNFYSVNAEKVIEFMNEEVELTSELKSTHWSVDGLGELNTTMSDNENDSLVDTNSTLSELKTNSLSVENDTAIKKNINKNTEERIANNNTEITEVYYSPQMINNITTKFAEHITDRFKLNNFIIEIDEDWGGWNNWLDICFGDDTSVRNNYTNRLNQYQNGIFK